MLLAVQERLRAVTLGFGRTVVSEMEAPFLSEFGIKWVDGGAKQHNVTDATLGDRPAAPHHRPRECPAGLSTDIWITRVWIMDFQTSAINTAVATCTAPPA